MSQTTILLNLKELLNKNNIPFWLIYGTLLGAYRDKDFIKWDKRDIDIGLLSSDYWKVRQILDNSNFKYKRIWRREIAIFEGESIHPHIDLFFHDIDNKITYSYLYAPSTLTNKWDVELRLSCETRLIFPLKTIKFLDTTFNIPNRTLAYIITQYGKNWHKPDSKWVTNVHNTSIEKDYRSIAIIIPTFVRTEKLISEIKSIQKHIDARKYTFYIGNQDKENLLKINFFKELKSQNHKIFNLPYNCGLSNARNYLISRSIEPLILIIDDDFEFTDSTKLDIFEDILIENPNIGCVGGKLSNRDTFNHNLFYDKEKKQIQYISIKPTVLNTTTTFVNKPFRYFYCDSILNFFLAKREMFQDISWDNNLKLVEHTDFFLRLKDTKWKSTFTPEVEADHQKEKNSSEYAQFRGKINKLNSVKFFCDKYKLNGLEDIIKIPTSHEEKQSSPSLNILGTIENTQYMTVLDIINYLSHIDLEFWLLKDSCYQAIIKNNFNFIKLQIGVRTEKIKQKLNSLNFGERLEITVEATRRIKKCTINQLTIYVPLPVVMYLEKYTGKKWEILQNEK